MQQIQRDVAIADRIDRIARRFGEAEFARGRGAIERKRRAGQRRRTERTEARRIRYRASEAYRRAHEALRRAVEPERERHRLRRLPMRRCGQQRAGLQRAERAFFEGVRDAEREPRAGCGAIARVEQERRSDLIVAAAAGVQRRAGFGREFAHARIDRAVNVFERAAPRERHERAVGDLFGHDVERGVQFAGRNAREQTAAFERRDVRARTAHVERREHEIVSSDEPKASSTASGADAKTPTPLERGLLAGARHRQLVTSVDRCAASAALAEPAAIGRPQISMKPVAASCLNVSSLPYVASVSL